MKNVKTVLANLPSIENLQSPNGNDVPNQFRIIFKDGVLFQSYTTIIVFKTNKGQIFLDSEKWNYSNTTSKYRNMFLGETSKEIQAKIESGVYILTNLNN